MFLLLQIVTIMRLCLLEGIQNLMSSKIVFFQVAHHIHEWMAEKLYTGYNKETECLNRDTSMTNCNQLLLDRTFLVDIIDEISHSSCVCSTSQFLLIGVSPWPLRRGVEITWHVKWILLSSSPRSQTCPAPPLPPLITPSFCISFVSPWKRC